MSLPLPVLDHVIVNVRDKLDAAADRWRRLGFSLTPKGFHTLGSVNHLAIFGTDYLELLAVEPDNPAGADVLDWPEGLNGVVMKSADADATYAALAGAPVEPPAAFSRPVSFAGGMGEAAFRVVRVSRDAMPAGRLFFCQHLTPELVWRPEWQDHPNGVLGIEAAVLASGQPQRLGDLFAGLFGTSPLLYGPDGLRLQAGPTAIEVLRPASLAARLENAAPGAAGRTEYMAGLVLRTASLDQAATALHAGGIAVRRDAGTLVVPAAEANGVALIFKE